MKKFLLITFSVTFLFACKNPNTEQKVKDNFQSFDSVKPEKDFKGVVTEQFNYYKEAIFNNNIDSVMLFVYPEMETYVKKKFPDENINMREIMKESMKGINDLRQNKSITLNYKIENVIEITNSQKFNFYLVKTKMQIKKNDKENIINENNLGISKDNGKKWQFVTVDEELREFLVTEFGESSTIDIFNAIKN